MTILAFVMFISLILLIVNTLDPRIVNKADVINSVIKMGLGAVLGFVIILLYGIGVPGLKYLFMVIGFGGLGHLFLSHKSSEIYNV